jgi:hypothetical protein
MVNDRSYFIDMYQCLYCSNFWYNKHIIDKRANSCTKKKKQSLISAKPMAVDAMYKIQVNVMT